jgi:alpha-N-arabinofuranosidase
MTRHTISVDVDRRIGAIDRGIFGGFLEHLGRCIHGGVYEPGSPHADAEGLRLDVLEALRRLRLANIRYPGGNFVSGYRWRDGVGPHESRQPRLDLAWRGVDPNTFGTDEFLALCRRLGTEPYLVVNAGDGDMREARDWVEYCNGTSPTEPVRLRTAHGHPEPYGVRLWGIGNEVDGDWQIGAKTAAEYERTYHEMAKVMRWVDPTIQLVASGTSAWDDTFVERAQLLVERSGDLIDYMSIHWYVGDKEGDRAAYLATSELIEERLSGYAGLMRGLALQQRSPRGPIPLAVDEWNVWYRATPDASSPEFNGLEETYDLADALVVAMHLNAFIRHAPTVRMANLAQLVNVIAPIMTTTQDMVLQTIFHPFELYSRLCGRVALDVRWDGDTFSGGTHAGVRGLDVAATLDEAGRRLTVHVINRAPQGDAEVELDLGRARPSAPIEVHTIAGPDLDATNTFDHPDRVGVSVASRASEGEGPTVLELGAHSVSVLVIPI